MGLEADKPRLFIADPEVMEAADSLGMRLLGLAPQVEHVAPPGITLATLQRRSEEPQRGHFSPFSLASLSALRR
jgi:hypothetical protein